ncbi:MAG: cytidylate kinase [Rhodobiaceae bacterium]|nr:cytidylate kinase [Rhodobiaceae bacterium]|tara:strand:- start:140 stop:787 length:648 start_codon:yes stop_codon:yes gene_type:complete
MTIVVAIDGPAGSGKGTIAKEVSSFYDFPHLDSGILYRSVALLYQESGKKDFNDNDILALANSINLKEIDLDKIRNKEIDEISSRISSIISVRESLKKFQLNFKKINNEKKGIVVDGRDITTVIFPEAEVKFYITASLEERADRRFKELERNDVKIEKKLLIKELQKRDQRDMERSTAPLKVAEDAFILDTSELTIDEVMVKVRIEIDKVLIDME